MDNSSLTGDAALDARLEQLITDITRSAPQMLEAVYLSGSYLDGSAVSRSDLDVILVFRDGARAAYGDTLRDIMEHAKSSGAVELGAMFLEMSHLARPQPAYLLAAQLIHGVDVIAACEPMTPDAVAKRWAIGALRLMKKLHGTERPLEAPLVAPAPGEASRGLCLTTSSEEPRTKLVVSCVARIAGARLAHEAGIQTKSKKECLEAFRSRIGGSYAQLAKDCAEVLKGEWEYAVPTADAERERLGQILDDFIRFEGDFLERLRSWSAALDPSSCDDETRAWLESCHAHMVL